MQVARVVGAEEVVATDVYDAALECARELGAARTYDGRETPAQALASDVLAWTDRRGVEAVFDTTGQLGLQQAALRMLAPGGTLMLMAGAADGLALSTAGLAGERVVTTSSNNTPAEFERGLCLLAEGRVRVGSMITHILDLPEAERAFAVAANKHDTGALKVIIRPR